MLVAFVIHEVRTPYPWLDFHVVLARPLPYLLLNIAILRLSILSTAYLIPYFLGGVRGFRALQVGDTLIWIAAPQLIICPLAAFLLRRSDARIVASLGLCLVGFACMTVAYGLTPIWGSDQFLPSQLMQAVGQSFALSGIVFVGVLNLRPQDALTFGAAVQVARLMGGEIGLAFVVTFARVREQVASNLIGLHVQGGSGAVLQRLQGYAAVTAKAGGAGAGDPAAGASRAAGVLGNLVRGMATTQAVIDSFVAVGTLTAVALLLAITHRPAPLGPASARPLFTSRQDSTP
jgi:DHA2 family multidrug resistance protein